ncbi:arylamine N-acetyltransferase 1-like [Paramuricea clavata]|uniref:arylamine N-acetyltransferase n=1 Tax=Paramuricea clavata TaxID=317549 RepID=A0A6S7J7Q4_PARCT|nr:arylamine N-acetyltransferase 1-like [Paramuricea clavata]
MSKTEKELEMFTREEAVEFLQNSWKIKNVVERMKTDRKNLADEIVTHILEKVPFQSISLVAAKPEDRNRPSFEDIKAMCTAGVGGLCYEMNIFTWGLLRGVGFDARMAGSTVTSAVTSPNNHTIVLISGVEQDGDVYLADCGTGFPIFRTVSLDFTEESPIFKDGFLEYKYVRHEGKILRMHGKGDMVKRNNPPVEGLDFFIGRWRRFYSFVPKIKPSELLSKEHFKSSIYLTPFTSSPRALWFPGKRAVVIANNKLIIEKETGEMVTTVLKSDEEILKAYQDHFPQLKQDTIRLALAEWHSASKS